MCIRINNISTLVKPVHLLLATRWHLLLVAISLLFLWPVLSHGKPQTRLLPSGEGLELRFDGPHGQYTDILPIHTIQGIPYFSAGVGQEERTADYPPYSLKIEFLIQGGAYTGFVDLVVKRNIDQSEFSIPKEHAKGPWLFINLPPGVYSITGTREGFSQTRKEIELVSGLQTTTRLIWDK